MSREREMPDGRWARIMVPTPNQMKYRMSGFERQYFPNGLDYWRRGLMFTWIWEDLGKEWYWYEQTWFFRGTREYWMLYVPYFWRNGEEFYAFEARFIKEATASRGTISESDFIQMAKAHKAQLQLGAIQGPLLSVVAGGGGAAGALASVMSKISDAENYVDIVKCWASEKGYEEACGKVVQNVLMTGGQKALSR